jgi:hypothetical protein
LEESLQPRDWLLNAITTLLMRNYEVVATAVNGAYKSLALRIASFKQDYDTDDESDQQESKSSELAALPAKAVADDDESDYQETESSNSSAALLLAKALAPSIVTITNPQDDDYYSFGDDLCLLVQKGNSHIGECFGDWDQLLAIP